MSPVLIKLEEKLETIQWIFYLETSKYLKKYASYEKNGCDKNFLFLMENPNMQ